MAVAGVAYPGVGHLARKVRDEPVEPIGPRAPEPLTTRGAVAAVLDHLAVSVPRPRHGGRSVAGRPGSRGLSRSVASNATVLVAGARYPP